jgi:hypothetical protein
MQVKLGTGNIDGTRCDQGDELVLVDGQSFLLIVVMLEIAAEPVRERGVDLRVMNVKHYSRPLLPQA